MRNNPRYPSPRNSSNHSRSPSPRVYRSKHPSNKNRSYSSNSTLSPIKIAIFIFIFIFMVSIICTISLYLNPPTNYCNGMFCKKCPNGAICTDTNFTCKDQNEVKFFEICNKPGNLFQSENLSLLFKYQKLLYDYVESRGVVSIDEAVKANLHLDNENTKLNADDIQIIWTYDNHYYIDDDGILRHNVSPLFYTFSLSALFLILIAILYYINYKYFS